MIFAYFKLSQLNKEQGFLFQVVWIEQKKSFFYWKLSDHLCPQKRQERRTWVWILQWMLTYYFTYMSHNMTCTYLVIWSFMCSVSMRDMPFLQASYDPFCLRYVTEYITLIYLMPNVTGMKFVFNKFLNLSSNHFLHTAWKIDNTTRNYD